MEPAGADIGGRLGGRSSDLPIKDAQVQKKWKEKSVEATG